MKANYYVFFIFALIISQISLLGLAQTDTTQVRYLKFSTTVSADYTRIALQEIKAYSEGVNVAPDNTISANSNVYDGNLGTIIDDDNTSGWFSDDYSTLTSDMGVGPTNNHPHYIIVDLGSKFNLQSMNLNLGESSGFVYTFDFLVSEDAVNWSTVDSRYRVGGTFTYNSIPLQEVRYIKYACYYSSDIGQVNVHEIQAYSGGVNVALNKTVTASSYEYGDATTNGKNAVDGNNATRWSSNRNDYVSETRPETAPVIVTVDLGNIQTIDSLQLIYNSNTIFQLSVSTDGTEWLQIDQRLNDQNNYTYILNRTVSVTAALISVSNTSALCMATVSAFDGSGIIARGVCWSTSTNPTINDNKTTNGADKGKFWPTLTGLTNNTVYYARAYVTTASGTKYSQEFSFLSGLTIQTDVITGLTSTSANTGGFVAANNEIQLTEKGLCWSTNSSPTIADNKITQGSDPGEFSSTLTGLTNDTRYYVRAYATTNAGTFYGNICSFRYQPQRYLSNYDGFFPNETFVETGTYNDQAYYMSSNGISLYFDGTYWLIGDFITSEESGNPPLTGWWDGTVLTYLSSQSATVSYNKNALKESSLNNGSFIETLTITHDNTNGATFTGINDEDFIKTGKAFVRNLPEGLTARIIRTNSLTLTLSIAGCANNHAALNSLNNLKVMLLSNAFSNGNRSLSNGNSYTLSLDFTEPVSIIVTDTKNSSDYVIAPENDVILESNAIFTIDNTTTANQLILKPGAKLTVSNAVTLNNLILRASDTESFSTDINTQITVNEVVLFEKAMSDSSMYFLSFPCNISVSDISINGSGTVGEDFYIYSYDGAARATSGQADSWIEFGGDSLQAAKGYAFRLKQGAGSQTLTFKLTNSVVQPATEVSIPARFYDGDSSNNHKGWNLISQPYLFKLAGSGAGIHYITTHDGNSYSGLTNALISTLNPFQAFFVQVADSTSIPFYLSGKQNIRSLVNQNNSETLQLNMTNASGSDFCTLLFDNERSSSYEIGQDLEKWLSTGTYKPQIYSRLNGVNFAYNALPVSEVVNLPIGFYSKSGGASVLSASNINVSGIVKLMLNDSQTGGSADLTKEDYPFNADAGTNNTRFSISIQNVWTDAEDINNGNAPFAYVKNSQLIIKNLTPGTHIRLYDATGRMLLNKLDAETSTCQIPLSQAGIYLIQTETNSGIHNFKVLK